MKRLFALLGICVIFAVLFFGFSVIVKKGHFTQLDFDTTVRLQDHTPVRLDKIFPVFSVLAALPTMSVILFLTLVLLQKRSGILVFILFFAAHSVEVFGKVYIHHPPPPFLFYKHLDSAQFQLQKYYTAAGSSYPSGHSFRAVFVGTVLLLLVWRLKKLSTLWKLLLALCIFGVITLVCVSRVSLGEHWTSDVIGGALFGISMAALGVAVL